MEALQTKTTLNCIDLGTISYGDGLAVQEKLHAERKAELIGDTALFLEHTHVITLGKRGSEDDILLEREILEKRGIEVFRSTRGGQVTYHGPGQLVVYLIFNLYNAQRELRLFVEKLEKTVIGFLAEKYGLAAHIEPEHPGVWVGDRKLAALGIAVKDRVTMHGLALNVHPDLSLFDTIIPCGIRDRGVCSLAQLVPQPPSLEEVKHDLAASLASHYGYQKELWVQSSSVSR